ncbi:aggregation promoting protein [Lactobacillus sp. ESL0679]|uniref:aggregation-promoting factor C-terminal-like domain-containing protein n=1 Tax=Lactobacillus sp. ESL0679 TaxID=2983209 RepID=UPI0023FA11C3|nr:aggregation promoting protein [Lactobacillus sp. ESL0679]MDF7682865.1 aggregation promoting protein [Lactobacillus sp. ESL0679]
MKKTVKVLSEAAAILGMIAPVALTSISNVSAATTEVANDQEVSANIAPVANRDNNSLRQIAQNNGVELKTLEKLNANVDPDVALPNGTPIYLPQNAYTDMDLILTRAVSPYANVPASIKAKYYDTLSAANRSAKNWIAKRESGYSYTARNGRYYGRFQLDQSYLNGDFSKTNQEKTANRYVKNRYGSWVNAKAHWQSYGWY